jgi:hypothetical protein
MQEWHGVGKTSAERTEPGTRQNKKFRNDEMMGRLWKGPECNNGLRNRGLSQQLRGKTGIKDPLKRQQLRLESERTTSEFDRKAFELEFVKRANGMSNGLKKLKKWALWRGRPPLKRRKRSRAG